MDPSTDVIQPDCCVISGREAQGFARVQSYGVCVSLMGSKGLADKSDAGIRHPSSVGATVATGHRLSSVEEPHAAIGAGRCQQWHARSITTTR
eukprot:scaffold255733_cov32-Tisochrysis_lutea.AAC.3